ncbi:hypothetical protein [Maritalea mediterranea]|uniref:Uncharacterized protein n=1 Tax=Maritalea mediterranea TaxID=2909667 RepID=A0ABS9E4S6_9HYPH|nr:hypothetical protein [Maritalea mediterranea]MCF4097865.1 hypothetical protein [Maritalea mediterranea]
MVWPFKKRKTFVQSNASPVQQVERFTKHLGLDLTPYGAGVALLSTESGYSPAETASHFAVVTIARDMKAAMDDIEDMVSLVPRGYAILECLKDLKDKGFIREELWANDATAIGKIINPSSETEEWIERILSDPVVAKEAVAISRI